MDWYGLLLLYTKRGRFMKKSLILIIVLFLYLQPALAVRFMRPSQKKVQHHEEEPKSILPNR